MHTSQVDDGEIEDDAPSTQSKIAAPVSAQLAERAVLVMLSGSNAGQVFRLDRDELVIGRSKRADVCIDDTAVSRRNTRILRVGSVYFVEDLGSRNGTFKNGARVTRAELRSGDRVHVSPSIALRFAVMDEAEEVLAKQLYEASTRDPLTGCFNRRYFDERLVAEVAFAHRHETKIAVMLIDVDHFKRVNDTFGHKGGDVVLRQVARAIQGAIRAEDVFARYGGEEFAVLVRGVDHAGVTAFAERLRATVGRLVLELDGAGGGQTLRVTVSIGVASLESRADDLLLLADARLYRAKELGRDRVVA